MTANIQERSFDCKLIYYIINKKFRGGDKAILLSKVKNINRRVLDGKEDNRRVLNAIEGKSKGPLDSNGVSCIVQEATRTSDGNYISNRWSTTVIQRENSFVLMKKQIDTTFNFKHVVVDIFSLS
ncbi:hypothetical protein YC2023_087599 [Brassica napus]